MLFNLSLNERTRPSYLHSFYAGRKRLYDFSGAYTTNIFEEKWVSCYLVSGQKSHFRQNIISLYWIRYIVLLPPSRIRAEEIKPKFFWYRNTSRGEEKREKGAGQRGMSFAKTLPLTLVSRTTGVSCISRRHLDIIQRNLPTPLYRHLFPGASVTAKWQSRRLYYFALPRPTFLAPFTDWTTEGKHNRESFVTSTRSVNYSRELQPWSVYNCFTRWSKWIISYFLSLSLVNEKYLMKHI